MTTPLKLKGRFPFRFKDKTKKLKLNLEGKNVLGDLEREAAELFGLTPALVSLEYKDPSGDMIAIDRNVELQDALEEMEDAEKQIKFYIQVSPEDAEETGDDSELGGEDSRLGRGAGLDSKGGDIEMFDMRRGISDEPIAPMDEVEVAMPPQIQRCCSWSIVGVSVLLLIAVIAFGATTDLNNRRQPNTPNPPSPAASDGSSSARAPSVHATTSYPTTMRPTIRPTLRPSNQDATSDPGDEPSMSPGERMARSGRTRSPSVRETPRPTQRPSTQRPTTQRPTTTRPTTQRPTSARSPSLRPTKMPNNLPARFPTHQLFTTYWPTPAGVTSERPIRSLSDQRYGNSFPPQFSDERMRFWAEQKAKRVEEQNYKKANYAHYDKDFAILNTWEESRQAVCDNLNAEKDRRFPPMYEMDPDPKPGQPPAAAASVIGFDPETVKRHVTQWRSKLVEYYEASGVLESNIIPSRGKGGYEEGMDKLAESFAWSIVNKRPVRIGVLGTSVVAAADNCFHYAYPLQLGRMLAPLFRLAGSDVEIRTSGQNGDGWTADGQTRCLSSILGPTDELDIVQFGWWMIPTPVPMMEEATRRLLARGIFPHFSSGLTNIRDESAKSRYYRLGLMEIANGNWEALDEGRWFPALGKSHWGRQGDNRCHRQTREGAPGVLYYNWHPGPLGFQILADHWAYRYTGALASALEMIKAEAEKGADALRSRFPAERRRVTALPSPIDPHTAAFNNGYDDVRCAVGQHPSWGTNSNITSWLVDKDAAENPHKGEPQSWRVQQTKAKAWFGRCVQTFAGTPGNPEYEHRPDCDHPDDGFSLVGDRNSGWAVFKLPNLVHGNVYMCNKEKRSGVTRHLCDPQVFLNADEVTVDWGHRAFGTCVPVVKNYALKEGLYMSIKCGGGGQLKLWAIMAE